MDKKQITILWLDDKREPNKYFAKQSTSGAWQRNNDYYVNNIFNQYDPKFVWVKNIEEFQDYIANNGLPQMVSFDHDLTVDKNNPLPNGTDCAKWLVQYCKENGLKLPKCFVHSANRKRIPEVEGVLGMNESKKVIKLTEAQLHMVIKESVCKILKGIY